MSSFGSASNRIFAAGYAFRRRQVPVGDAVLRVLSLSRTSSAVHDADISSEYRVPRRTLHRYTRKFVRDMAVAAYR